MEEIWKKAVHSRFQMWVNNYEISNKGNIRNKKQKILKLRTSKDGYYYVRLGYRYRTDIFIHHLVAETFIGIRPVGLVIDHIDAIKTNNNHSNLQYLTVEENSKKGGIKRLIQNEEKTKESVSKNIS
jgi:hypothetical protein